MQLSDEEVRSWLFGVAKSVGLGGTSANGAICWRSRENALDPGTGWRLGDYGAESLQGFPLPGRRIGCRGRDRLRVRSARSLSLSRRDGPLPKPPLPAPAIRPRPRTSPARRRAAGRRGRKPPPARGEPPARGSRLRRPTTMARRSLRATLAAEAAPAGEPTAGLRRRHSISCASRRTVPSSWPATPPEAKVERHGVAGDRKHGRPAMTAASPSFWTSR